VTDTQNRIERGHPPNYFILGDALRGIACMMVVVNHVVIGLVGHFAVFAGDPIHAYGAFSFIALRIGSPLIYIFFALSAYLVGGPWVRAWLGDRPSPKIPIFIARRARRLLPAFWLVIAFRLITKGDYAFTDHQIIGTFLGLQTFYGGLQQALMPQGWTVNVEIFFYILLPVAFVAATRLTPLMRADRETRRRVLVGSVLLWSLVGIVLRTQVAPDGAWGHSVVTLGWSFTPGLLAAAYEKELRAYALDPAGAARLKLTGLALVAAGIVSEILIISFQVDDGKVASELAHLICGAGFLGGALLYEWSGTKIPRVLDNEPVHALGRWSYGVYLLHITIAQQLLEHAPDSYGPDQMLAYLLIGTFALTLPAAALLWRYWEEPWLDWRWPWQRKQPATA
jgi:peptidoglycan/LPS O-acetylase OafA/YrhL